MMTSPFPRLRTSKERLGLLVVAAVLLGLTAEAHAQRALQEHLKNGTSVRRAFRDVVADARLATVRVLSEGEQVAQGAIVDSSGYVLTKASQLRGDISCRLADDRTFEAHVVGIHKDFDLAMLKIDAAGLPVVAWREDHDAAVGQWLATPGPGSLPVSVGVVSVRPRSIPAERGILGVSVSEEDGKPGSKIIEVLPNSGAAQAGLKVGDIITRVAGTAIADGAALASRLQSLAPGDMVDLIVRRDDESLEVRATLRAASSSIPDRAYFQNQLGGQLSLRRVGFPSALQHDTVLRPEDCGGPLVDLSGQAVGLNIARAGRTETYAIPAADLLPVISELMSGKLAPQILANSTRRDTQPVAADGM